MLHPFRGTALDIIPTDGSTPGELTRSEMPGPKSANPGRGVLSYDVEVALLFFFLFFSCFFPVFVS